MTRQEIWAAAMRQTAVDCSCQPEDFLRETNVVAASVPSEGASRYMALPHILALFSYGSNVVASCRADLIPEITAFVDGVPRFHNCFEPPAVYALNRILRRAGAEIGGLHSYYLPDPARVFGADLSCPYETRLLRQADFADLYRPEWGHALCSDRKELDVLGVGAFDGGKLVGLAACSADCPGMWQIGIDVLPAYRRQGVASALTNRLARAVFERDRIPFYAAAWSNVRSAKNAYRSGFVPAWVALTARKAEGADDR